MPLGKLSKLQIAKGLETLIDIEEAIKNNKVKRLKCPVYGIDNGEFSS